MEVIVYCQREEADKKRKNYKDVNLQLLECKRNYGERVKN